MVVAALLAATAPVVGGTGPTAAADAGGPGYVLSTVEVGDQSLTMRWDPCQPAITYAVNARHASGSARGRRSAVRDARAAVERLATATGMTFVYAGATRHLPTGESWHERAPAEIVIAWVDQRRPSAASTLLGTTAGGRDAAGTGGYHFWRWSTDGAGWVGAIGRGFVVLNARGTARPGFGAGLTRGNLLLHELGHVVGLAHTDDAGQLMDPVLSERTGAGFADGDLAGLALLGRAAGCIEVPTGLWPDR